MWERNNNSPEGVLAARGTLLFPALGDWGPGVGVAGVRVGAAPEGDVGDRLLLLLGVATRLLCYGRVGVDQNGITKD